MTHSVRTHLRLEIDDYDRTIRRWIPGYETMLSEAAAAAASIAPARVVDLGSGTGALSAAVLEWRQVEHVELLDVDPEMMNRARARLRKHGVRVAFTLGSYYDPLPACDAFVACISLHHVRTLEEKTQLFGRAYDALRPGGLLANADCTMPIDPVERQGQYESWAAHMMRYGIDEQDAWQHFKEWAVEDTYLPIEQEIDALKAVGFAVDVVWRLPPMGVVVARKPDTCAYRKAHPQVQVPAGVDRWPANNSERERACLRAAKMLAS